jgi:hypothetical protein
MTVTGYPFPFLLVTALTLGCRDAASPPLGAPALGARVAADSPVPIAHAYSSGLGDSARLVIADSATWAAIWAQVYAGLQPRPALPAVDFRTQRVLLAALGQRNSGGYDIRIDSVVRFTLGSVAYVTTTAPGRACVTTQAFTQPVDLVRVAPPPVAPVVFAQQAVVRACA